MNMIWMGKLFPYSRNKQVYEHIDANRETSMRILKNVWDQENI